MAHEAQPFKHRFGPDMVADLARRIGALSPSFPQAAFVASVAPQLEPLELKARVAVIAAGPRAHLPPGCPAALLVLLATLGPPHTEAEGIFTHGWRPAQRYVCGNATRSLRFRGGQNTRANTAATALERPDAWRCAPLSRNAGEGQGMRVHRRIPMPSTVSALMRSSALEFAPVGVRPVYPGPHAIAIQVNDVELGVVALEVAPGIA